MRLFSNTSTWVITGALAVAVPLCVAQTNPSQAQSQNPQTSSQATSHPSRSSMSANERAANLLNTVNKSEIDDAQMVAGRTQNAQVKDFAQMVMNDHKDAQSKLESAASAANINLSENKAMGKANDKMEKQWKNDSVANMDKSYVNAEIRDHRMALRRLKSLEPQITDPQLKSVVQDSIPVLQKHMKAAQQLSSQLGGGSGSGSGH